MTDWPEFSTAFARRLNLDVRMDQHICMKSTTVDGLRQENAMRIARGACDHSLEACNPRMGRENIFSDKIRGVNLDERNENLSEGNNFPAFLRRFIYLFMYLFYKIQ